ncbi:MAG: penicillin-binding protein [Candidatus Obscuribacterales bacterium]|nr:penicillin-binding protein [Candidatus Obscuribacterales bacterium]
MARRTKTQSSKKAAKRPSPFWQFVRGLMLVLFLLGMLGGGYAAAMLWQQLKDLPDIAMLERYEPIEAIQIYDRNDRLVCTVEGDEDRRVVALSQIAPQMQQAILAAEDHHFYEHHGVNPISFVRAFLVNMQAGHVVEGGSTITMQLVKNLFFEEAGRTMGRKVKEVFISSEIESRYSKDKILEMYLNQVYFGNGAYGIERAASRYFDRSAASLDLAQSAFLAGLVKAPSEYAEQANRKVALSRQHEIIDKMVEYGYITQAQAEAAKKEELQFKKGVNPLQKFPYYVSYVLDQLRGRFSQSEMRKQGLRVFTNLDPQVQELAEKTLNAGIEKAPKGVSQGALVCVQVRDCAVLAIVGGVGNYWKNQWNRATNPHTAGSSFKPFVYLTAFQKRTFSPDSLIDDSPISIKQGWGLPIWQPKNFDHKYMGKITLRKALTNSRNVPSVRIAQAVGIDSIIETARLAGITSKLDPNLSLALGSSAVSPLELAGAYTTFARGGIAIHPQVIRRIENTRGQTIETFESRYDKAFDSDAVAQLVSILQDVVKFGTGTQAKLADRPVAGKTGTADAGKDIWFAGFTPDTVTVVWGGNDENLPIPGHNVTGGTVMAKIWRLFMEAYYQSHPSPAGAFMEASRNRIDVNQNQSEGSPSADPNNPNMPKLVPIDPSAEQGTADPNNIPATEQTNMPEAAPEPGMPPLAPNLAAPQQPAANPAPAQPQ